MVPSTTGSYPEWFVQNNGPTNADLYFFGHGLDYKAALQDFLLLSGPPGMLSAADYGLWWSNSFVFTKDQFLNRLISNFSMHNLPFTHLVMDYGWHQQQDGRLWASVFVKKKNKIMYSYSRRKKNISLCYFFFHEILPT